MINAYERVAQRLLLNQPKPQRFCKLFGNRLVCGTKSLHRTAQSRRWQLFWRMKSRISTVKMRYWTIVTPQDSAGTPLYETLSEAEILEQYYPYWSAKMIEKYGFAEFNKNWTTQDCIDDWCVVHWAWESESWAK